jgi:hypothetical protein
MAPEEPQEIWGQTLPGYQEYFTLPNVAGAALWNNTSLYVTEQNAGRSFDIQSFNRYGQASASSLSFTFVNSSAGSFKVIKLLSDASWQEEVFTPSWAQTTLSELVTSFSPDGRNLLALDLFSGTYSLYKGASSNGRMEADGDDCDGFSGPTDEESLRALRWSLDGSKVYLGTQTGTVYQLTPAQGCETKDLAPQITLAQAHAVLDIQADKDHQLLISQPNLISKVNSASHPWTVVASMPTACLLPMGALALDENHLLIACLVSHISLDPAQVPLALPLQDQIQYLVHHIPSAEERVVTLQDSTIAGLAIDPAEKRLYVMSSSSLGILEQYNLLTGEKEVQSGLLLDGILDR